MRPPRLTSARFSPRPAQKSPGTNLDDRPSNSRLRPRKHALVGHWALRSEATRPCRDRHHAGGIVSENDVHRIEEAVALYKVTSSKASTCATRLRSKNGSSQSGNGSDKDAAGALPIGRTLHGPRAITASGHRLYLPAAGAGTLARGSPPADDAAVGAQRPTSARP